MRNNIIENLGYSLKQVFKTGLPKKIRTNTNSEYYGFITSYNTYSRYFNALRPFVKYLKKQFKLKNFTKIELNHIVEYFKVMVNQNITLQSIKVFSCALAKLELVLNKKIKRVDFSIRNELVSYISKNKLLVNNRRYRGYKDPEKLIAAIKDEKSRLIATIMYESGTRVSSACYLDVGKALTRVFYSDAYDNKLKVLLMTKEKGGRKGEIAINTGTFEKMIDFFEDKGIFRANYNKFLKDLKEACLLCNENYEASHGFRYNFAVRRYDEYKKSEYNFTEDQILRKISWEMKHNRISITKYYLNIKPRRKIKNKEFKELIKGIDDILLKHRLSKYQNPGKINYKSAA